MTHEQFKAARKALGLTQGELAYHLGYGKRQVWSYENDPAVDVPPVVTLAMLALSDGYRALPEKNSQ